MFILVKNVVLIGGGDIATHYHTLIENPSINLMALCDLDPQCPARKLFKNISFYENYKDFSKWNDVDYAIVAATASAHNNIITDLLKNGISVISEKPLAGSIEEVNNLYKLAEENNAEIKVLFHWRYLIEMEWLTKNLNISESISEITMDIHDNYAINNGIIRSDRIGMLGAWIDCGINALSLVDSILSLKNIKHIDYSSETDKNCGHAVYEVHDYLIGNIPMHISVDWRNDMRDKIFTFILNNGSKIDIIHRKGSRRQEIELNGEVIKVFKTEDSLADQYRKMFEQVMFSDTYKNNKEISLRIHKILFDKTI